MSYPATFSTAPCGQNHSEMSPDHLGYFTRVHRRSVTLVHHVLRNDPAAAAVLVSEVEGSGATQIVSLAQLCGLLLAQMPAEQRESLLNKAGTTLAATDYRTLRLQQRTDDDHRPGEHPGRSRWRSVSA